MKADKNSAENFRETLRNWRKHMDFKQAVQLAVRGKRTFEMADAARFLGVPRRTYEGWERRTRPKVPQPLVRKLILAKIARTFKAVKVRY